MSTTPSVPPGNPSDPRPVALPHIGEEYGTGTKNLPPAKIVAITLGVLVVALGAAAFFFKAKSPATGAIDEVESVEIADQNMVMAEINISIQNGGKTNFKMRSVTTELMTGNDTYTDAPAAAVDFDRYLQAFPTLKQHVLAPLKVETIEPGGTRTGTVLVSFPVTAAAFANRKYLKVTVFAYGEPAPLVMMK
jgi:hypothetical protein